MKPFRRVFNYNWFGSFLLLGTCLLMMFSQPIVFWGLKPTFSDGVQDYTQNLLNLDYKQDRRKAVSYLAKSKSMPYVAIGVVGLFFITRRFFYKLRYIWPGIVVSAVICLMVVSNQLLLVRVVGSGQNDIEFKYLAQWYTANAEPGEKMVTTMVGILNIFASKSKGSFVNTGTSALKADAPQEFVKKCYE
ncbi:MAG: hypothetical protein ACFFBD_07305, partial [Candidatus Hodarchaeota archaeon]